MSTFRRGAEGWEADQGEIAEIPPIGEADYRAWCMALGDYLRQDRVQEGAAGPVGRDRFSAIVAAMAADALGPENVRCVMLPSRVHLAPIRWRMPRRRRRRLGCRLDTVPISGAQAAVGEALGAAFCRDRAGDHRGKHPVPPARR